MANAALYLDLDLDNTWDSSTTGGTGSTALVITFNGQASVAAVQALARRITFRNTITVPPTAHRTIEWKLTDLLGGGISVKTEAIPVTL